MDASAVWMNSSETYCNVEPTTNPITGQPSTQADFISIGGKFEFFMFGTTNDPKQNHTKLSTLTGFPPMPSAHSLGFHYCKWETNSAELMIERSKLFTYHQFPLDVLWTDLYYTQDFEYFVFNRDTWPLNHVTALQAELEAEKRRFVTINDPHLRANDTYWIFNEGNILQNATQPEGNITNIYIRNMYANETFIGNCWPGPSAWVDYLNTNAANYWG
jgi:alpha 1,3-glucosidase